MNRDLLTTWGREFCAVLDDSTEATPQDGYEAHVVAFARAPDIAFFRRMGAAEFAALAAAAGAHLEVTAITSEQMRMAVSRTIAHWD